MAAALWAQGQAPGSGRSSEPKVQPGALRDRKVPTGSQTRGDWNQSWQSPWVATELRARQTDAPGSGVDGKGKRGACFLCAAAGQLHQCGHDYLDVWGQGTLVTVSSGNCNPSCLALALGVHLGAGEPAAWAASSGSEVDGAGQEGLCWGRSRDRSWGQGTLVPMSSGKTASLWPFVPAPELKVPETPGVCGAQSSEGCLCDSGGPLCGVGRGAGRAGSASGVRPLWPGGQAGPRFLYTP